MPQKQSLKIKDVIHVNLQFKFTCFKCGGRVRARRVFDGDDADLDDCIEIKVGRCPQCEQIKEDKLKEAEEVLSSFHLLAKKAFGSFNMITTPNVENVLGGMGGVGSTKKEKWE